MTNAQIAETVVVAVIGKIAPVGDQGIDDERYENLKQMNNLIETLVASIAHVAAFRHRPEDSMARSGERAQAFLEQLIDYV